MLNVSVGDFFAGVQNRLTGLCAESKTCSKWSAAVNKRYFASGQEAETVTGKAAEKAAEVFTSVRGAFADTTANVREYADGWRGPVADCTNDLTACANNLWNKADLRGRTETLVSDVRTQLNDVLSTRTGQAAVLAVGLSTFAIATAFLFADRLVASEDSKESNDVRNNDVAMFI